MKIPPFYALYCVAVLAGFSYAKYAGIAFSSAFASQSRGGYSSGMYHHYYGFYHK